MTAQHIRERVAAESADLAGKIERLSDFIVTPDFAALDAMDRSLLSQQLNAMRSYSFSLRARLARWGMSDDAKVIG